MRFGDVCRASCSAPARYLNDGLCVWISCMSNDVMVTEAAEATGGEARFPLPTDEMLHAAGAGVRAGRALGMQPAGEREGK